MLCALLLSGLTPAAVQAVDLAMRLELSLAVLPPTLVRASLYFAANLPNQPPVHFARML